MNLSTLTREDILNKRIPMKELLEDSVYYPACYDDGRPIKYCNTIWRKLGVNSFVYCDFAMSERELLHQLGTVRGYHVLAHRSLLRDEYIPEGWELELGGRNRHGYYDTFLGSGREFPPYAHWAVFERDSYKDPLYGPERFSLIYVGGEGLATFQQLYCHWHIAPKMLCFIQCWGFAGNWTDFTDPDAAFATTLRRHPECIPERVCIGSYGEINGVLRIRGTEYLGAKFVGYSSPEAVARFFENNPVCIRRENENGAYLAFKGGRTYLLMSLYAKHLAYVIYDVTDSKYDVNVIADNLVLKEIQGPANPEDCLNAWLGFKESTHKDCNGRDVPELDLEYGTCKNWTGLSVRIVNACLDFYRKEKLDICTERMHSYMKWAFGNLSRPNGPQSRKFLEAQAIVFQMFFYKRATRSGIRESAEKLSQ
jgi:hypothetical protein